MKIFLKFRVMADVWFCGVFCLAADAVCNFCLLSEPLKKIPYYDACRNRHIE